MKDFHSWHDVIAVVLVLSGLSWFTSSFFLAKHTLIHRSGCDEANELLRNQLGMTDDEIRQLIELQLLSNSSNHKRNGCWMDRSVDSVIVLVVDALRFDFAYYNLPNSIGKRLSQSLGHGIGEKEDETDEKDPDKTTERQLSAGAAGTRSRLFQFVADPPTVTMQRIKALTSGGLPTFADISSNFGGATVEEDTWIRQLLSPSANSSRSVPQRINNYSISDCEDSCVNESYLSRGLHHPTSAAFVGDDTWEDLFPQTFTVSYPYPSFNTRDLDTVDNGCLQHLPGLVKAMRSHKFKDKTLADEFNKNNNNSTRGEFEVIVAHFLGVDHVGHTYGPHNYHMDMKLRQIDTALTSILETVDNSDSEDGRVASDDCDAVLIFGDHGMTSDGNHGGGTPEETNAALFVHLSMGCPAMYDSAQFLEQTSSSLSSIVNNVLPSAWNVPNPEQFTSIHQIDLVPTISLLLGLPIPYANLGSVLPSIIPTTARKMTVALALNAAQVWRYYTDYATTANKLPNLHLLRDKLELAISTLKHALEIENASGSEASMINDTLSIVTTADDKYLESSGLFKLFLSDALELGQRVWTRFDTVGMIGGILVLSIGWLWYSLPLIVTVVQDFIDINPAQRRHNVRLSVSKNFLARLIPLFAETFQIQKRSLSSQYLENFIAFLFIIFYCGMLTFSNSYILEEHHTCMFSLAVLCVIVALRIFHNKSRRSKMLSMNTSSGYRIQEGRNGDSKKSKNKLLSTTSSWILCWIVLLIPISSRIHESYVTGHGLDPSIRGVHPVHQSLFFVTSSIVLMIIRLSLQAVHVTDSWVQTFTDCASLLFLLASWWEKRQIDPMRNGYRFCQISLLILLLSTILHYVLKCAQIETSFVYVEKCDTIKNERVIKNLISVSIKILIAVMAFTGPSTASSMVLYSLQIIALFQLAITPTSIKWVKHPPDILKNNNGTSSKGLPIIRSTPVVSPFILATLAKLITRHAFFSTNHGCFFNRLQYSSAFVVQEDFNFIAGGIALSTNTFGWEVVGSLFVWAISHVYNNNNHDNNQAYSKVSINSVTRTTTTTTTATTTGSKMTLRNSKSHHELSSSHTTSVWRIYCTFQYLEALCSCISVTVLRRHLMVWDIYAPHFLFTMIFTVINVVLQLLMMVCSYLSQTSE